MEGLRLLDESKRDEGRQPRKKRKMSSSKTNLGLPQILTAAVLTVSDSSARGERADLSGPAVAEILKRKEVSDCRD